MNDKFSFQQSEAEKIENAALTCADCVFAYSDRVVDCVKFNQKPLSVLNGEDCQKKHKTE